MSAVFWLIDSILGLYWWIVIASVVLSWLYAFNVVNPSNPFVRAVGQFVHDATEPLLGRIRRIMPNLGSIDISPIVLLFGIMFLRIFINDTIRPTVFRML